MKELNSKQKRILELLHTVYPNNLKKHELIEKLGSKSTNISADIEPLIECKLVDAHKTYGDLFPAHMKITEKGIEKLQESQETIITRLKDSAYNNPWMVITIILTIFSIIIPTYYSSINYELQQHNNELQEEISDLSKPYIINNGLLSMSKSENVDIPFNARNPSDKEYTIDLSKSGCNFGTDLISKYDSKNSEKTNYLIILKDSNNRIVSNPNVPSSLAIFPPKTTLELKCNGASIHQAINETDSFVEACMKITAFNNPICEKIPIKILSSRVITINGTLS